MQLRGNESGQMRHTPGARGHYPRHDSDNRLGESSADREEAIRAVARALGAPAAAIEPA
jgi:hypothetical protein